MKIDGTDAAGYDVIRLDSLATVNTGTLTAADDENGYVAWKDRADQPKDITLGANRIKIVPRSPYRR